MGPSQVFFFLERSDWLVKEVELRQQSTRGSVVFPHSNPYKYQLVSLAVLQLSKPKRFQTFQIIIQSFQNQVSFSELTFFFFFFLSNLCFRIRFTWFGFESVIFDYSALDLNLWFLSYSACSYSFRHCCRICFGFEFFCYLTQELC